MLFFHTCIFKNHRNFHFRVLFLMSCVVTSVFADADQNKSSAS
nr:MAG TPA_asm: hypothetical protein [Caudoviricetes sp.]